jgi:hypothetical protein
MSERTVSLASFAFLSLLSVAMLELLGTGTAERLWWGACAANAAIIAGVLAVALEPRAVHGVTSLSCALSPV